MSSSQDRISEEAARAIWRRAAQLQAEAELRMEERTRGLAAALENDPTGGDGLHPDDIRSAAEQAGISPEFVQIALAEAAAGGPTSVVAPGDLVGSRLFLGATRRSIEATTIVPGSVDEVSAASLQVFSGHPCLLQAGEVAELSSTSGRVIVFNVPKYDWSATANPPFVEKAAGIGLSQIHVAVRPMPVEPSACEVVVAGDLHRGMRRLWRWSAATSVAASAVGGAAGVGVAGSALAGALLVLPAIAGAAVVSGAAVALWAGSYRYYRRQVGESLDQSLRLLPAAARAIAMHRSSADAARQELTPQPRHGELPR